MRPLGLVKSLDNEILREYFVPQLSTQEQIFHMRLGVTVRKIIFHIEGQFIYQNWWGIRIEGTTTNLKGGRIIIDIGTQSPSNKSTEQPTGSNPGNPIAAAPFAGNSHRGASGRPTNAAATRNRALKHRDRAWFAPISFQRRSQIAEGAAQLFAPVVPHRSQLFAAGVLYRRRGEQARETPHGRPLRWRRRRRRRRSRIQLEIVRGVWVDLARVRRRANTARWTRVQRNCRNSHGFLTTNPDQFLNFKQLHTGPRSKTPQKKL